MKNYFIAIVAGTVLVSGSPAADSTGAKIQDDITFSGDIASIIFSECASCHRPGEAAPFPLTNYREVVKRGRLLKRVITEGFMPPWHPVEGHGEFMYERRLTSDQVDAIVGWVDAGMPEGDPTQTPPMPDYPNGWRLGEPDLVVTMEEAFEIPADGKDIYRQFVIPVPVSQDKWVRAVEVRAGDGGALHHVLIFLDSTGTARRLDAADPTPGFRGMRFRQTGSLGGWAVGSGPKELPEGLAMALPAGSDIVLASHFHPTGKPVSEKTKIGLFFSDEAPEKPLLGIQLPPGFGVRAGINIPAGDKAFEVKDSITLPVATDLVSVGAHMHYLGKSARAVATLPSGEKKELFYIDDWDFNWQDTYRYREPVRLPKDTRIDVELVWDNSAENPHNQFDPPQRVRWGRESTDEMGSISFVCVAADKSDHTLLARSLGGRSSSLAGGSNVAADPDEDSRPAPSGEDQRGELIGRFEKADRDGDGVLAGAELPASFRSSKLMTWLDIDKDGKITRAEAESGQKVASDAARGNHVGLFQRMDTDGDGILRGGEIPSELRNGVLMKQLDKDGNGEIGRDELPESAPKRGGELLRKLLEKR